MREVFISSTHLQPNQYTSNGYLQGSCSMFSLEHHCGSSSPQKVQHTWPHTLSPHRLPWNKECHSWYKLHVRTKNGVTSVEMEYLVSTIIVYMTTTNNKGLIPSLSSFLSYYKLRRRKNILFLNAVEKRLSFLKPTFIHIFDYLVFRFILEKQRNYQCCPITIFCANKLLVPCYLSSLQK